VLPLVAGLFVLVEALGYTGVIAGPSRALQDAVARDPNGATWLVGILTAVSCNLLNNLPVGLMAGSVVAIDNLPSHMIGAGLIAVNLGPNLSITGSLATILWLLALRRELLDVSTWTFLKLGLVVMPPALVLSIFTLTFSRFH
jgi:arsenical pump membrane protein